MALVHETWTSAYWLQLEQELLADIRATTEEALPGWENVIPVIEETLMEVREEMGRTRQEEAERATWTPAQWMEAETQERETLAHFEETPVDQREPYLCDLIAQTRARAAFFHRPQIEALETLLEGVEL